MKRFSLATAAIAAGLLTLTPSLAHADWALFYTYSPVPNTTPVIFYTPDINPQDGSATAMGQSDLGSQDYFSIAMCTAAVTPSSPSPVTASCSLPGEGYPSLGIYVSYSGTQPTTGFTLTIQTVASAIAFADGHTGTSSSVSTHADNVPDLNPSGLKTSSSFYFPAPVLDPVTIGYTYDSSGNVLESVEGTGILLEMEGVASTGTASEDVTYAFQQNLTTFNFTDLGVQRGYSSPGYFLPVYGNASITASGNDAAGGAVVTTCSIRIS